MKAVPAGALFYISDYKMHNLKSCLINHKKDIFNYTSSIGGMSYSNEHLFILR